MMNDEEAWTDMKDNSVSFYYPEGLVEEFPLTGLIDPQYYESVAQ